MDSLPPRYDSINGCLQADTGTKMVHVGPNTRSRIVSKGISAGDSRNVYRGVVQLGGSRDGNEDGSGPQERYACKAVPQQIAVLGVVPTLMRV
eukprot:1156625-Pelagomonas_calceolata.AAC.12